MLTGFHDSRLHIRLLYRGSYHEESRVCVGHSLQGGHTVLGHFLADDVACNVLVVCHSRLSLDTREANRAILVADEGIVIAGKEHTGIVGIGNVEMYRRFVCDVFQSGKPVHLLSGFGHNRGLAGLFIIDDYLFDVNGCGRSLPIGKNDFSGS